MDLELLAAASEGISPGLVWAGVGLLILSFILPRMMLKRRPQAGAATHITREREQEVKRTLDDVFLQLQEFSREAMGKLDTRIRMLNQLIVDADERIRKLQAMPPLPSAPLAAAPAPPSPPPPPAPSRNPIHERIWRLLDGGATIGDVSREVGMPKGEVELIAGLRSLPTGSP